MEGPFFQVTVLKSLSFKKYRVSKMWSFFENAVTPSFMEETYFRCCSKLMSLCTIGVLSTGGVAFRT